MRSLAWSALDYGTGCTEIPSQTVLTREDAETAIREFVKAIEAAQQQVADALRVLSHTTNTYGGY